MQEKQKSGTERETHTHTCAHASNQANTHARTQASTHADTHAHTRTHAHAHTHAHARARAHTHTHTHTHTHPITYTFTQKWFKAECSVFFGYSQTPYISHTYWFGDLPTTTTNKQTLSKQNGLSSLAIHRHVRPKTCCGLLVKLTWRYRN